MAPSSLPLFASKPSHAGHDPIPCVPGGRELCERLVSDEIQNVVTVCVQVNSVAVSLKEPKSGILASVSLW